MEPRQVIDDAELEAAFVAPVFLLFKHSLICPVSERAFAQYRTFLAGHDDLPTAWLDVIGQRPLSQAVEARTRVRHESPQVLVLAEGAVRWHASHGAITAESLAGALAQSGS